MSSFDRSSLRSALSGIPTRRLVLAAGVFAVLLAGGCNVRPLYGPAEVGNASLTTVLADVDVAPVDGRVPQKVRNDLLFLLNGGDPGAGTYVVTLKVEERYTNIITRTISGLPGGRNIRLEVDYALKKQDEPDTVLAEGTVTRISSFDYFNQRFANDRATIDAEDRAAQEVAADIQLRLASYFVTGKSSDQVAPETVPEDQVPDFGTSVFDDQQPTYGAPGY
jgi:LPS-assembly lipoprotein